MEEKKMTLNEFLEIAEITKEFLDGSFVLSKVWNDVQNGERAIFSINDNMIEIYNHELVVKVPFGESRK